jgi:DNA-binding transcriptional ArsR family regulator
MYNDPSPRQARGRPPAAAFVPLTLDTVCSALAHRARRTILQLLREYGPLTPLDLRRAFPHAQQSAISAHVRVLRTAGLIDVVAGGDLRQRRYELAPRAGHELRAWLLRCFPDTLEVSLAAGHARKESLLSFERLMRLARRAGQDNNSPGNNS